MWAVPGPPFPSPLSSFFPLPPKKNWNSHPKITQKCEGANPALIPCSFPKIFWFSRGSLSHLGTHSWKFSRAPGSQGRARTNRGVLCIFGSCCLFVLGADLPRNSPLFFPQKHPSFFNFISHFISNSLWEYAPCTLALKRWFSSFSSYSFLFLSFSSFLLWEILVLLNPVKPPQAEWAPHISPRPKKKPSRPNNSTQTTPDWGKNISKKRCETHFFTSYPGSESRWRGGAKRRQLKSRNLSKSSRNNSFPTRFWNREIPARAQLVPGISTPAMLEEYNKN